MSANFNFDGGKITPYGVAAIGGAEIYRRHIESSKRDDKERAKLVVQISKDFKTKQIPKAVAIQAYRDTGLKQVEIKKIVEEIQQDFTSQKANSSNINGASIGIAMSQSKSMNMNNFNDVPDNPHINRLYIKIYTKNDTDLLEISDLPYTVAKTTIDCLKLDEKLKTQLLFDIRVSQTFSTHELIPEIAPRFYIYDTSETWPSLLIAFTSIISICSLFISKFMKRNRYR